PFSCFCCMAEPLNGMAAALASRGQAAIVPADQTRPIRTGSVVRLAAWTAMARVMVGKGAPYAQQCQSASAPHGRGSAWCRQCLCDLCEDREECRDHRRG